MFVSISEGFCRDGEFGAILLRADILAVMSRRCPDCLFDWEKIDVELEMESWLGGCGRRILFPGALPAVLIHG